MTHPIYDLLFKPRLRYFTEVENSYSRLLLADEFGNEIDVREFKNKGKDKRADYYSGKITISGASYCLYSTRITSYLVDDLIKCLSIYRCDGGRMFDEIWLHSDLVQSIEIMDNPEMFDKTCFECFIRAYPLLKNFSFRYKDSKVSGVFNNERVGLNSVYFTTLENVWKDCVFHQSGFYNVCNRVPFLSEQQVDTIRTCLSSNKCINNIYERSKKNKIDIGSEIHAAVIKILSGVPLQNCCSIGIANVAMTIANIVRGRIIPTYKNYSSFSAEQHCPDGSRPDIILRDLESNAIALIEIKTTTNPTKDALDEKVNEHIEKAKKSAISLEPLRDMDIWFIVANQETGSVEFKKVEPDKPRTTQQIMYDLMPMNMLSCYTVV